VRAISTLASILAQLGVITIANLAEINIISRTILLNLTLFNRCDVHMGLLKLIKIMLSSSTQNLRNHLIRRLAFLLLLSLSILLYILLYY
jgi:hypothetical protein